MDADRLRPAELFRLFRCSAATKRGRRCSREVIWFAWMAPRPLHPRCWQHQIATTRPAQPAGVQR